MMKKTIVIVACCALIAPLATAQTSSTTTTQTTTTTTSETVTVTGTIVATTPVGGTAAAYQPANTIVIRADNSNLPGNYILNGPGNIVNKNGDAVQPPIKPGTHVQIFYANVGGQKIVDHIVVD